MAADFKSHVLMRDEKGMMGIPFKRLLLAGVSGGFAYTLLRLGVPGWAIPGGVVVGIGVLVMTGLRGGLPLWQRWLLHVRGSLLLAAMRAPGGMFGQLATALELPVTLARMDGVDVFAPPARDTALELREWVTFVRAEADEGDGLVFVDAPFVTVGDAR